MWYGEGEDAAFRFLGGGKDTTKSSPGTGFYPEKDNGFSPN